ncbi:MAG: hypothetical protein STHCBS139747_003924 [Sporothrix thermara]
MVASPCLLSAALAVTQATAAAAATCTCTSYSQIPSAVASCTSIVLNNIAMPASTALDLTKLKTGATVTFEGKTTFAKTSDSDFTPILVGGTDITITASSGAIIDGNGQAYWDGLGSNGGVDKPNKFMTFSKVKGNSVVKNLHIQNWPVHLFSLSGCEGLTMQDLTLDNSAGDAANSASDGLAAAHNSDGFDISTSSDILLQRVVIDNQDDCVAIASGNNITVSKFTCRGGHGLSIGSIGGKSNNNVTNVLFTDSTVSNSQNGCRIKSNSGTTGFVSDITYSNIALSGITTYGIDIQQDYLNGGPTGVPTNGVLIENITFDNVTGTAASSARDYYILCGSGSCSNFKFSDVSITGGSKASSCNYPSSTCP